MRPSSVRSSIRGLLGVVAVLALLLSAARSEEPAVRDAARASLPPRALVRIGTDLLRTPGNIRSFALSPGGRLVAAGDLHAPSPRITIFDVRTGRRVKQLVAPENRPGLGRDGRVLAGRHETALGRGVRRGRPLGPVDRSVAVSPEAPSGATSSTSKCSRPMAACSPAAATDGVDSPPAGREARGVRAGCHACRGSAHLAFTPDGRRLVAGSLFSTMIGVWDANDGRFLREIGPTAGDHLKSMAVTPDSRHILSAGHREEVRGRGGTTGERGSRAEKLHALDARQAAADAADRETDRDPALGHRDRRAHPGPQRSGGDRLRRRRPLARRPEDGDRQLPRTSHAGRFHARAAVDDRPARLVGPAGRVLVRWQTRRPAGAEHRRDLRGRHGAAAAPRREHARRPGRRGGLVAVGRSDRHRPFRRVRAGLGRRHRQADLAQAPGTHRQRRAARPPLPSSWASRATASCWSRPATGTIRRTPARGSSWSTRPPPARWHARSLGDGSDWRRRRPTAGWSSSPTTIASSGSRP